MYRRCPRCNPDGSAVLGEDHRPIQEMLRNYLALALNNTAQGENEVFTPEQKPKIYALTTKLYSKKEGDLTLDDRAFLKERVGKGRRQTIHCCHVAQWVLHRCG